MEQDSFLLDMAARGLHHNASNSRYTAARKRCNRIQVQYQCANLRLPGCRTGHTMRREGLEWIPLLCQGSHCDENGSRNKLNRQRLGSCGLFGGHILRTPRHRSPPDVLSDRENCREFQEVVVVPELEETLVLRDRR